MDLAASCKHIGTSISSLCYKYLYYVATFHTRQDLYRFINYLFLSSLEHLASKYLLLYVV